jgi:hypothetical protein
MIEKGDRTVELDDLRALLTIYQASSPGVVDLAHRLRDGSSQRGRWRGARASHDVALRPYVDLEEDAVRLRHVSSEQLPDQLQCPSYMEADYPRHTEDPAEADALEARRLRQANVILRQDNPPEVLTIFSESCIRRVQGNDPTIMREQIEFLLQLQQLEHVTLQIVPFRRPDLARRRPASSIARQGILERFSLLRLTVPEVPEETSRQLDLAFTKTGNELAWTGNVEHYEILWTNALAAALRPAKTRLLLEEARRDFT